MPPAAFNNDNQNVHELPITAVVYVLINVPVEQCCSLRMLVRICIKYVIIKCIMYNKYLYIVYKSKQNAPALSEWQAKKDDKQVVYLIWPYQNSMQTQGSGVVSWY